MVINKRGQAFLMAAVIIAGLVLGSAKITNTARAGSDAGAFYDLTKEVGFETAKVLDYGIINSQTINDAYITGFLSKYAEYISGEEVLFIWGDAAGAQYSAINYQISPASVITIQTGGGAPIAVPISVTTATNAYVSANNNEIKVTIRGIDYKFKVREGQKFYFVLIKDENGEKFVAKR